MVGRHSCLPSAGRQEWLPSKHVRFSFCNLPPLLYDSCFNFNTERHILATDWNTIFQAQGAMWIHDGKPSRPHALLTSGLHSDGFVNCSLVTQHASLLERIVQGGDGLAPRLSDTADWVIGSAMGAVT